MREIEITFLENDYNRVREHLIRSDTANEQFLFALGNESRSANVCRVLVRSVAYGGLPCVLGQSRVSVRPDPVYTLFMWTIAKKTGSVIIHSHSHPFADRAVGFSGIDDAGDRESFAKAAKHLGGGPYISMVVGKNSLDARYYDPEAKVIQPVHSIKVIGDRRLEIIPSSQRRGTDQDSAPSVKLEIYDRQVRVFGPAGQQKLKKSSAGVVGCGGIGSLICEGLARLGVGTLVLVDPDIVEPSNLNRLGGSTPIDALRENPKVMMLRRHLHRINPGCKVIPLRASIMDNPEVLDVLKSVDVILGCTDNQSSRDTLNQFSSKHLIPYFDTGTGIQADKDLKIDHAGGQVRIVIPGKGCLHCINGIDMDIVQQETLPKAERQAAVQRGYIAGVDERAPAVLSLNGVIAHLAVTEYMAYITGFRPLKRFIFYDFMNATVRSGNFPRNEGCYTCSPFGLLGTGDNGKIMPADIPMEIFNPPANNPSPEETQS
jgi:molybdopterin-synthase adenylyltransferase